MRRTLLKVTHPVGLRGVSTVVHQTVDFSQLTKPELKRVLSCVKRGWAPRSGYCSTLLEATSKHLGEPRVFGTYIDREGLYVYGVNKKLVPQFEEIIKLSDVRAEMYYAKIGRHPYNWTAYKRGIPGFVHGEHDSITLHGFGRHNVARPGDWQRPLKTALEGVVGYREAMARIAAYIERVPSFTIITQQN